MHPSAPWWESRQAAAVLILLAAVPLLWPPVAPLTDLPGHIGRYRIMAEAGVPPLSDHYTVTWRLVGNLGVDVLVLLLAPWLGLEPAVKLIVIAIPMLMVAAMLWLAREAHGRVPATALFALPLAYAAPFQLGFVNFAVATAGVFAGLALWLRLARTRTDWVRAIVFVPIAGLLWLCHAFGWALFGLFAFGAEWALRRQRGKGSWHAGLAAGAMCAPMLLPVAILLATGAAAPDGGTDYWFQWQIKLFALLSVLRERWQLWDIIGAAVTLLTLLLALVSPRFRFSTLLGVPAVIGAIAFVLLPYHYAGGSNVDGRVLPVTLAVALLAIRPVETSLGRSIAMAGGVFYVARILGSTVAFALFSQGWAPVLRAAETLPVGAPVLVLVNEPPVGAWENPRLAHIAGLATARRRVFTNEQWAMTGQQLITPRHPAAAPFDRDPSQLVQIPAVPSRVDLPDALARFDRATFRYLWAINVPPGAIDRRDLTPLRRDEQSVIYRVAAPSQAGGSTN